MGSSWGQQQPQQQAVKSSSAGSYQAEQSRRPAAQQQAAAPRSAAQLTTNEEHWMDFFGDRTAWYDNREKKMSGELKQTAPDFKKKEGGSELYTQLVCMIFPLFMVNI
jgi:hypothetical protein